MPFRLFVFLVSIRSALAADPVTICGGDEIYQIDPAAGHDTRLWSWRAKDRPEIPEALRGTFSTTDECKPADGGRRMLVCSSGGGCALLEMPSGKALWWARVTNAHSIESLPDNGIAVAASVGGTGNKVVFFDAAVPEKPVAEIALPSAHGLVWDAGRNGLWALGFKELLFLTLPRDAAPLAYRVASRHPLPDEDGHDLRPVPGSAELILSTHSHVFRFHRDTREFRKDPDLGDRVEVKGIDIHPVSGRTLVVQASGGNWWATHVEQLHPAARISPAKAKIYKARWHVGGGVKPLPGGPLEETASRGVTARDPSTIVREGDTYWTFFTGRGVPSLYSKDLVTWKRGPAVHAAAPSWIKEEVPANDGVYWAPDLMKVGGRYLLYYSVSSFGAMRSAIGLATNPTLDPADPAFRWTDHGVVVRSRDGGDFNAIDPAVFKDDDGSLWLSFGSQWSGLKLVELDPATGMMLKPAAPMTPIAAGKSIEAAYIFRRGAYYYLFLNRGDCCRGDRSTYHIKVGRGDGVMGPYIARDGTPMLEGGGTMVLDVKTGTLTGPGHAGIVSKAGREWFSCHFEADDRMGGKATLGLMPIRWTDDAWPEVTPPDKADGGS